MQTKTRRLGELTIEEPVLDAEGQMKQNSLAAEALLEYEEAHTLTGETLREKVEQYEKEISRHLVD